jgi:transposase
LFPEFLEDWIDAENPVRVIDAFVDELDLPAHGFDRVVSNRIACPPYHPSVLLKLYIYGYLNRVQSSRRLEREAGRNVEVMWLTGRLAPDFKTIADFHKDYGVAIRLVCAWFVELCREIGLFTESCVAIDGSKFKAVNSRDRNATRGKEERRKKEIEKSITRYLHELDTADRQEPSVARTMKKKRLSDRLSMLKEKMEELESLEAEMLAAPDQQASMTDPDARSMAIKAKAVLGKEALEVLADSGYYSGGEILACDKAGVTVTLPKPRASSVNIKGRYGKQDFRYMAADDVYVCPAGERLSYHFINVEKGQRGVSEILCFGP